MTSSIKTACLREPVNFSNDCVRSLRVHWAHESDKAFGNLVQPLDQSLAGKLS